MGCRPVVEVIKYVRESSKRTKVKHVEKHIDVYVDDP
jgi:hypothetical protein